MEAGTTLLDAVLIIQEARYAIVAVYSLQVYEWFVTLDKEIDLVSANETRQRYELVLTAINQIHKARWTSVKVTYLLCRYYTLFLWPIVMAAYCRAWSWNFCNRWGPPVHVLFMPCQLFPQGKPGEERHETCTNPARSSFKRSAVMLMRAYAFSGRDKRILALLLTCYAGLCAVDIWSFCTHISTLPEILFLALGGTGCYPYYGVGYMGFRIGYSMLAATLMDLISLIIVLMHCSRNANREVSLARYFVNQGLVSFGLVIAVNIIAATFFFNQKSPHNGLGLPFIMVVSNLIACRV
ncbi:hypothetical protein DXG01_015289 [Tephrocybe rancida]|nr:hypothetical protein DXG01_015289 [Tephrocybe rancida]